MNTTEIKKELYRQKPMARQTAFVGDYTHYVAQLSDLTIVQFYIPNIESTFEKTVPAQLLIRWLVI